VGYPKTGSDYGLIDDLTYQYTGNQLQKVDDSNNPACQNNGFSDNGSFSSNEYFYDLNGNMIQDLNKEISNIDYTFTNLPQKVVLSTIEEEDIIYFWYDAAGQKLRKQTRTDGAIVATTDYIGSFVYENGFLQYILTNEGRIVYDRFNDTYQYQYFLKDHLGNTRILFDENGSVLQDNSYYPFGMAIDALCHSENFTPDNKYLFNGKELQDDFGLEWYDYGTRFYDPQLGRWHVPDPMAEKLSSFSPYNYTLNNPIFFIDPDGMFLRDYDIDAFNEGGYHTDKTNKIIFAEIEVTDFLDKDGNLIIHVDDGSNAVFQLTGDSRSEEYFKFTGYDEKQGGKNEVNVKSAIKGAQDYTRENYTSDINDKGVCTQTYCNYGTMNIAKTYESAVEATGKTADISDVKGSSRTIGDNLSKSEVVKTATDLSAAQKSAKEGSLVIGYWTGHVFTLNKQGMVNNVGAPRAKNNVFDPKYTEGKGQKFYIIQVK